MTENDLIPSPERPPLGAAILNQMGANGLQIAHATNVNMPIHVQYMQPIPGQPAMSIPSALSSDFYQLIVTDDFDPTSTTVPIDPKRALTESMCPTVADSLKKLDEEAVNSLRTYPALIMNENDEFGTASQEQLAYFAAVTNIRVGTRNIKIEYYPLTQIPQRKLNQLLDELDLDGNSKFNELNRTHWAVKNVDLVRELARAGISVLTPTFIGEHS